MNQNKYKYIDCDDCPYCYKQFYSDGLLKVRVCDFDEKDLCQNLEPICEDTEFYY